MKIQYDLTLEGDDLYYENRDRWLEAHNDAQCLITKKSDPEFIKAEYKCPTREDFINFKKIDEILKNQPNS